MFINKTNLWFLMNHCICQLFLITIIIIWCCTKWRVTLNDRGRKSLPKHLVHVSHKKIKCLWFYVFLRVLWVIISRLTILIQGAPMVGHLQIIANNNQIVIIYSSMVNELWSLDLMNTKSFDTNENPLLDVWNMYSFFFSFEITT